MNELNEIVCEICLWQCAGFMGFCALGAVYVLTNAGEHLTDLWTRIAARIEVRARYRRERRRNPLRTEHIPGTTGYRIKTR